MYQIAALSFTAQPEIHLTILAFGQLAGIGIAECLFAQDPMFLLNQTHFTPGRKPVAFLIEGNHHGVEVGMPTSNLR